MEAAPVLLVDDDEMLLHALSETISLRMSTVRVETTASAQKAVELLRERAYSAIISDIQMPGMDGFELLAHVQEQYPDIPVLLITGYNDRRMAKQALRAGAYDYIRKPLERDDFIAALYRALSTYQLRRQIRDQQYVIERYTLSMGRWSDPQSSR